MGSGLFRGIVGLSWGTLRWLPVPHLRRWAGDQNGSSSMEYAMLLGVMGVATVAAWQGLGESVRATVTAATAALDSLLH